MDDHAFDQLSRAMARGLPRRTLLARLGAGGLGAALFGVASLDRVRSAGTAAQAATCQLDLVANVRLGASAGATIGGAVPGELRGQLSFGFDDGGAISDGRLRLADGKELPVVGQALGRALHLRVQLGARQPLILVGTAEQDLGRCQGTVDGLLTGPQPGDLGDWHATATSLGQRGGATGGATGGGTSGTGRSGGVTGGTGSGSGSTQPPARTSTDGPTTQAPTTAPPTTDSGGCPDGQTDCDGTCIDPSSDPNNCGFCGLACGVGRTCSGGGCVCSAGYTDCLGICCAADEVCVEGFCQPALVEPVPACGAGLTNCFGVCADLQSDPAYCGACDTPCPTFCQGGVCVDEPLACQGNLTNCSGTCVDLASDRLNCRACGNSCGVLGICQAGLCFGGQGG